MTQKLNQTQIEAELLNAPDWAEVSGKIQRTFQLADFEAAMAFVNGLAEYAERVQHHPDMLIRFNKVTISVNTHDAGGITAKDFALAHEAERLAGVVATA